MKAIHNTVTFLAAIVVLSWAGWQTYLHWDILLNKAVVVPQTRQQHPPAKKCPCCNHCTCGKTDCKGACCADKKCCDICGCTEAGCCKK